MQDLIKALITARQRSENAKKNATNPDYKNRYADIAAVIDAVNSACEGLGLAFVQDCHSDSDNITVVTRILHESGQVMDLAPLTMPIAQKTPQGYGSALTYGRRYSLQTAFGIAAELDDDGNAASLRAAAKTLPSPANKNPDVIDAIKNCVEYEELVSLYNGLSAESRTLYMEEVKDKKAKLKELERQNGKVV